MRLLDKTYQTGLNYITHSLTSTKTGQTTITCSELHDDYTRRIKYVFNIIKYYVYTYMYINMLVYKIVCSFFPGLNERSLYVIIFLCDKLNISKIINK